MSPISESRLPPVPPEQRPSRLLVIDTTAIHSDAVYVNAAYEWLHQIAKRERELDAEVIASGSYYLILLQAPMVVSCAVTGWSFRMMAGIIHLNAGGYVNGWMISAHDEARETFDMLTNPERAMEEPPDADADEDDTEDEDA